MIKIEIEKSIEICIRGLNGTAGKDDCLFVLKTLEQISNEPYQGRGLGIGDEGVNEYRASWRDLAHRFVVSKKQIISCLDWKNVLLLFFDWANLNEYEMFEYAKKIEDAIMFNHILKHIIENLVRLSQIDKALSYTLFFRPTRILKDENNLYMGYRIIAEYYAKRGDVDEFFKLFKLCKPGTEKLKMELLKSTLIANVCLKDGIEAALRLCRHKNIGVKYYIDALYTYSENAEYAKLKEIFIQYPEIKQQCAETELILLVDACLNARRKGIETDVDFEELFNRATAVDSKLKAGDFRLRDTLNNKLSVHHA